MLYRMLKKLPFVESIEKEEQDTADLPSNQQTALNGILSELADSSLFKDTDPITWQKSLRDEWEKDP